MAQEKSGRGEGKDEEKSNHFSLSFFLIKKKIQVAYIEKSMSFRFSSKKGQFPYFF